MLLSKINGWVLATYCALLVVGSGTAVTAQIPEPINDLPNPYQSIDGWAKLPDGRTWGSTAGVDLSLIHI